MMNLVVEDFMVCEETFKIILEESSKMFQSPLKNHKQTTSIDYP